MRSASKFDNFLVVLLVHIFRTDKYKVDNFIRTPRYGQKDFKLISTSDIFVRSGLELFSSRDQCSLAAYLLKR